ncbi:MAG: sugar ABC transporter ATP-binding protein [Actinobacteria bacterium]|nr:sugar ABC transporter ATP-binding protein [Actinomycetota bacterium]
MTTERSPSSNGAATDVIVELASVSKHFGGVHALEEVSVRVERGTVHALVGENGAGKSTLGNIISGVYAPDAGKMLVNGAEVRYRTPREAARDGIVPVAQEIKLVPQRSVIENVFLGVESSKAGFYDRRELRRRYEELCRQTGIAMPAGTAVGELGIGAQQQVELLRALAREPKLLILDEPTAALTRKEVESLFQIVNRLRDEGTTIIYVSHFLDEILEISDNITVLRDGRLVRHSKAAEETPASLIEGMVGRELGLAFPARKPVEASAPVVLSARGLASQKIKDLDVEIRAGEILGVAGLMGAGRTSLARLLFGVTPLKSGTIELDGRELKLRSPRDAIKNGIALVPESRKEQGLVMPRSVRENLALVHGAEAAHGGFIDAGAEKEKVAGLMDRLDVRGRAGDAVWKLSGGNQQKVALAKWLWTSTRLLIVDEPARGIDIGAKQAMYRLIATLADEGSAVLMISSDIEELTGLSDRVIVLRQGALSGEFDSANFEEQAIVAASFGESPTYSKE